MIFGKTAVGDQVLSLGANYKYVSRFRTFSEPVRVPKVSVYLDGQGSGGGVSQVLRAIIYVDGSLVAESAEVAVLAGQEAGWVDFTFFDDEPSGVEIADDTTAYIGIHSGVEANVARARTASTPDPSISGSVTDTYSDGAAATLSGLSDSDDVLSIFATAFQEWEPPSETDQYYGGLPFAEAQAKFGESAPIPPVYRVDCGWHHTALDPDWGSYAIVKTGGSLAGLVGERVRITSRQTSKARSVIAYVHSEADLLDEVSLTRRLFAELSVLGVENIVVDVEVLA